MTHPIFFDGVFRLFHRRGAKKVGNMCTDVRAHSVSVPEGPPTVGWLTAAIISSGRTHRDAVATIAAASMAAELRATASIAEERQHIHVTCRATAVMKSRS